MNKLPESENLKLNCRVSLLWALFLCYSEVLILGSTVSTEFPTSPDNFFFLSSWESNAADNSEVAEQISQTLL